MGIKKSCGELRELDIVAFVNELEKLLLLLRDGCKMSRQLGGFGWISSEKIQVFRKQSLYLETTFEMHTALSTAEHC